MYKDVLAKQQPIVYQTLLNSLSKKQLSHCYLFVGPKGTGKKETAYLLAQSLICQHKDIFACEQCSDCNRILEGNYADLIYIDGTNQTIKNETIQQLQTRFERTALEQAGVKIFIIDGCENLTNKAANSLLKFIEEPYGQIVGIFITTQSQRILSTIVSRCQTLNFRPLSKDAFQQAALDYGLDELNSHMIANFISQNDQIEEISNDKCYLNSLNYFCEFTNLYFTNQKEATLYLQDTFSKLNKANDPKITRETFKFFLEMSLIFVSDYLNSYECEDQTYQNLLQLAKDNHFKYEDYLMSMSETRDGLNKSANCLLLIDQMLYKLTGGLK